MDTKWQIHISKSTARALRKSQTPSERLFWEAVRDRRFTDLKFLRQHAIRFRLDGRIRFFVADFYCAKKRLVIEIDGAVHDNEDQQERDEIRTMLINRLGHKVLRIRNDELMDITAVLDKILNLLQG